MSNPVPRSLAVWSQTLAEALGRRGLPHPRRDARALLTHVLGLPPDAVLLWPDRLVTREEEQRITAVLARRLAGEPLSRIRGEREFWSLPFRLSPATLDPRPDSETLIEAALRLYPDTAAPLAIFDLGTGSGCLLLSLLMTYQQAWGIGVDVSPLAAATARDNARQLGATDRAAFVAADWDTALQHGVRFDLVVSNPPYIPAGDIVGLDCAVRDYDPLLALDGGPDGLAAYRRIVPQLVHRLKPTGWALLEIGVGQAATVPALCTACGLAVTDVMQDLAGHPRIVIVKRADAV
jgi:release factor glutamine methyltransferase